MAANTSVEKGSPTRGSQGLVERHPSLRGKGWRMASLLGIFDFFGERL